MTSRRGERVRGESGHATAGAATYTCVGSGTCVPLASRGPACHLAGAGELRIVLDLGSGSLRSLARLGEAVLDLDAVGLTHRHTDHVADLLPLLFALRHAPGGRREAPLTVFGYAGLRRDLEGLARVHGGWVLEPGFELRLRELAPGESLRLARGGAAAEITAHATRHTPEALGFRLEMEASVPASLAYSGDTGASDALIGLAAGADLFVCECAFPDGQGVEGHLTPSELLPLLAEAAPRRTVTTHFYPTWDELGIERLWREALARFGAELDVVPARDGMRVELPGAPADPRARGEGVAAC
ncbi:MAG: MBL fold metallo-hydrolase [Gemmatimonadota bacterium]